MKLTGGAVVVQHFPHLRFRKTHQLIELRRQRVVGTDIETARHVVHRHRADTRHETAFDGCLGACLDGIEELAEITLTVRLALVVLQAGRVRKDVVREVVILIDEEENLAAHLITLVYQQLQLCHRAIGLFQFSSNTFGKQGCITVTERFELNETMLVHRTFIIAQSPVND